MGDPGYGETFTEPATGVKKVNKRNDFGDMANQASTAVAITGGSVVGATIAGKVQEITEAGAIALTSNHVKITGPASSTYAITLAAPTQGAQPLVIEMVSTTSTNAVTLALTNVIGGSAATTATFNAAAETLTLVSMSTKWVVLDEIGVTLA
jgi:hypothetical protein